MKEYETLDDEALALLAQSGDADATTLLLTRYKNLAAALARRYFLAGAGAEDLIQEAMIGLFRAISSFREGIPFRAYASSCIKNAVIDAVKKSLREKHRPLNESVSISDENEPMEYGQSAEQLALESEEREWLTALIQANLSKTEGEILALYAKGFRYREIAEKLEISTKTVDNYIRRIKQKLKKAAGEEDLF